jgi:hypothetical protein
MSNLERDVRRAKISDAANGTGPRRNTPKSFHDTDMDAEPNNKSSMLTSSPDVDVNSELCAVLNDVADEFEDGEQSRPAKMGHLAWAFRRVARKLARKERS